MQTYFDSHLQTSKFTRITTVTKIKRPRHNYRCLHNNLILYIIKLTILIHSELHIITY